MHLRIVPNERSHLRVVWEGDPANPTPATPTAWLNDDVALSGGIAAPMQFIKGLSRIYDNFGFFEEMANFYTRAVSGRILHPDMRFGAMELAGPIVEARGYYFNERLQLLLVSSVDIRYVDLKTIEVLDDLLNLRVSLTSISTIPAT